MKLNTEELLDRMEEVEGQRRRGIKTFEEYVSKSIETLLMWDRPAPQHTFEIRGNRYVSDDYAMLHPFNTAFLVEAQDFDGALEKSKTFFATGLFVVASIRKVN